MNINFYKISKAHSYLRITIDLNSDNDLFLDTLANELSTNNVDILEVTKSNSISTSKFIEIAKKIKLLCAEFNVIFLIQERCDIVLYLNCDGIFLPQDSLDTKFARHLIGETKIIGTQNTETEVSDFIINDKDNAPDIPHWNLKNSKPCQANNWVYLYR